MKKISVNVYDFKELDKEVQEKLIEKQRDIIQSDYIEYFLEDDMEEKSMELLKKYFGENANFNACYCELSYCQGGGAMIEFDLTYYNKNVNVKHYGSYCHERSFEILSDSLTEKQEKKLKEKIVLMNRELAKFGYNQIESNYLSDDEIIEILNENTYFDDSLVYEENYKGVY